LTKNNTSYPHHPHRDSGDARRRGWRLDRALDALGIATLHASLGNLVLVPLALVLTWALYVLAEAAMLRRFQRRLEDKGASREAASARS
jgi:hypothetical protein